jgi:acrylyl-CoA reductase (NADPH)
MIVPAKLGDLAKLGSEILAGKVRGRVVVDVNA